MMQRSEIVDFLTKIQAVDNRTITAETVTAWHDAATRQGWTFEDAHESMRRHFSESTDWLMPAHITQRVRTIRRDQHPGFKALPVAPESESAQQSRKRVMEEFRKRRNNRKVYSQ